jgi:hypothetical protein
MVSYLSSWSDWIGNGQTAVSSNLRRNHICLRVQACLSILCLGIALKNF